MALNTSHSSNDAIEDTHEKPAITHVETTAAFDIDSQDLPKGYFLRPFFIGTLIASGLSVSAVRNLFRRSSQSNNKRY